MPAGKDHLELRTETPGVKTTLGLLRYYIEPGVRLELAVAPGVWRCSASDPVERAKLPRLGQTTTLQ